MLEAHATSLELRLLLLMLSQQGIVLSSLLLLQLNLLHKMLLLQLLQVWRQRRRSTIAPTAVALQPGAIMCAPAGRHHTVATMKGASWNRQQQASRADCCSCCCCSSRV